MAGGDATGLGKALVEGCPRHMAEVGHRLDIPVVAGFGQYGFEQGRKTRFGEQRPQAGIDTAAGDEMTDNVEKQQVDQFADDWRRFVPPFFCLGQYQVE